MRQELRISGSVSPIDSKVADRTRLDKPFLASVGRTEASEGANSHFYRSAGDPVSKLGSGDVDDFGNLGELSSS